MSPAVWSLIGQLAGRVLDFAAARVEEAARAEVARAAAIDAMRRAREAALERMRKAAAAVASDELYEAAERERADGR